MKNRDEVLIKLNEWYSKKFKDNYTLDVEKNVMGVVKNKYIQKFFKREKQIGRANVHFTEIYPSLEEMVDVYDQTNCNMQPFTRQVEKLRGFVFAVRKAELLNGYLDDEIIDQEFVNYFGNMENYTRFTQEFIDSFKDVIFNLVLGGRFTNEQAERRIKAFEIRKEVTPYINDKLFTSVMQYKT